MNIWRIIRSALPCVFAAASVASFGAGRPNILVVLVDDMGWADIGPYGGEIRTPTLDSLAANGLRFRHFYNEARCSPTRIAVMTGLHMQAAAVDPNASLPNLRTDNNITMAELLGSHGYRTYKSGKWHLGAYANGRDPVSRGFQHAFGQGTYADGAGGDYWGETAVYGFVSSNGEITATNYPSGTFYKTDADVDYVLKYLDHHYGKHDGAPFFIYLAINAPHFSLQAPEQYINMYTDAGDPTPGDTDIYRYEDGWDLTRERRFARQQANGIVEPNYRLSPKSYENVGKTDIPAWDTLPQDRRNDLARRMAVYAAMVHKIDENVGRVIARLRAEGDLDNTLIFFFADNGGNSEGGLYGQTDGVNNAAPLAGTALQTMGLRGGALLHLGGGWANVNNTPLRFFKHHTHEGGCRTPLIVHWPAGIPEALRGKWTDERGHAIDIMATVADITGTAYPSTFGGHTVLPLQGVSLLPVLQGRTLPARDLFIEHERNRAMFRGDWKLVSKSFTQGGTDLPAYKLELYNIKKDPTELNNLGFYNTELMEDMILSWNNWVSSMAGLNVNRAATAITPDTSLFSMPVGTELFYDTFSRPNSTNIDSARDGISGTMATATMAPIDSTYFQGFGSNRTQIVNNRLRMAISSAGMSEAALMTNFVGSLITNAGGFSVEMTVTAMNTVTTEPEDRYVGFGVGLTASEAAAGADISQPGSFRGQADLASGLCDFFVELDLSGNVKVWSRGQLVETVPVGKTTGTLPAQFRLLSGFAAGDLVETSVLLDGVLLDINSADAGKTSRTFSWEHSDQNYIGLSVRATGYGEIDNLIVRPLPLTSALSAQHALRSGLSGSATYGPDDPDGDGLSTDAEWLWGTDPGRPDAAVAAITLGRGALNAQFVLRHRRVRNAALCGIEYPVSFSQDLRLPRELWQPPTVSSERTEPITGFPQHEWVERTISQDPTAFPSSFFTVKAVVSGGGN